MKKYLIIILLIFLLISCVKPVVIVEDIKNFHLIYTQEANASKIDKVLDGEDYMFRLPQKSTYNKVYVNGLEIVDKIDDRYIIKTVKKDTVITFNKQFLINLSKDEGYAIEINDGHSMLVNENDSVNFNLLIDENYNKSSPIVKANNQEVEIIENKFTINEINEDINITVDNIVKNQIISKPDESQNPDESNNVDYQQYSNSDLSWWYRYPSAYNSNIKPSIDSDISSLIGKYAGLWMLDTAEKKVVLTMDEGYEYKNNTNQILDIAKEKQVQITFFITGGYIDSHPKLVMRMVNEGHVVANHSNKHLRASPTLAVSNEKFINDISELEAKFKALTGDEIVGLYRPPEGGYSERSLAIAKDLGYKSIFWSFAYRDWLVDDQPSQEEAFDKIISQLHPGAIILLHAVSETNVAILGDLIDEIRNRGYTFTTIQ